MLKIHHVPRARGLRVIWLCEEMGLPYEVERVAFPPNEAYKKLNPMGTVPFLEDDGVAINESVAMMLYIAQKYGPTPLMPAPVDSRFARVLQMTVFGEATLGAYGNTVMSARFFAPEEHKQNWSVTASRERMLQGLLYVADVLGANAHLAGEQFTLADISVSYALGFARAMMDMEEELPKSLRDYHDRVTARPAFQRANAK
jgi:glutathione S-transferase